MLHERFMIYIVVFCRYANHESIGSEWLGLLTRYYKEIRINYATVINYVRPRLMGSYFLFVRMLVRACIFELIEN
jgi:hypothetical protein